MTAFSYTHHTEDTQQIVDEAIMMGEHCDLSEEDKLRFTDGACSMVGFNFDEHSAEYFLEILGCPATDIDIPNGASPSSPVFFRIKGILLFILQYWLLAKGFF